MKTDDLTAADLLPRRARGERVSGAKLTAAKVVQIRQLRRDGAAVKRIAAAFGVCAETVHALLRGQTWKHVPDPAVRTEEPDARRAPR
jgi:IS30 family transposase